MTSRADDFPEPVKRQAAKRVGFLCSNPECKRPTVGSHSDGNKSLSIGEACHIAAASPRGPRYDATMTSEERMSIGNALWLCNTCSTIIDNDDGAYPVELLRLWKSTAEWESSKRLVRPHETPQPSATSPVVVSYNQSGGQTALTIINAEPPPRTLLDRSIKNSLVARMRARPIDTITVNSVMGNSEAFAFAQTIVIALSQYMGLNVSTAGIESFIGGGSMIPLRVMSCRNEPDDAMRLLAEWMRSEGFATQFEIGSQNIIFVGPRPPSSR